MGQEKAAVCLPHTSRRGASGDVERRTSYVSGRRQGASLVFDGWGFEGDTDGGGKVGVRDDWS